MNKNAFSELLSEFVEKDVILIEPGGNHGDTLIYRGLERELDRLDINYRSRPYYVKWKPYQLIREVNELAYRNLGQAPLPVPRLDDPDVIVLHGGGNVNDMWPHGIMIFDVLAQRYPNTPIIVGPQAYWFSTTNFEEILSKHDQPIWLFSRDQYSHIILRKHNMPDNITLGLSDDTALYVTREDLLPYVQDNAGGYNLREEPYDLVAIRDDREGVVGEKRLNNLTEYVDHRIIREDISDVSFTFEEFVSFAEHAERIWTDRLHGSLLGTILEKKVEMFENAYFKNRGVYMQSLDSLDNVTFHDAV